MSSKSESKQQGPNKKLIWGFAIAGVAMMLYKYLVAEAPATQAATNKAPQAIDVGKNEINKITAQDQDAALVQFSKKIEAFQAKLDQAETEKAKSADDLQRQLRKMEQEQNNKDRVITEELAKIRQEQIDNIYKAVNKADKGTDPFVPMPDGKVPDGGLSFDGPDIDLGSSEAPEPSRATTAHPYGPNYFILRPQTQASYQGKSGGGQGSQSESELFAEMSAPDANAGKRAAAQSGTNMDATFDQLYGREPSAPRPVPQEKPVELSADELKAKKLKEDTYEIPAFSFVEVTTLHGVACPVGANAPGASDSSRIPARPVVLPVRGIFRGPNGVERDLGTIHLMGLCSGRRTSSSSTGRATIRVEQLSYWDASGGAQMVPSTGYIVDTRDNEQDVYGKLDKASGRTLALQSAAAAAAAYATTLSSAEFTNTSSVENGASTATSQLTGDASKAAVAQGIGAMFQKISERFEREADAAMDTILVEPGIKLRFVTDQPIKVLKPHEPFDIDASMYDTLI